MSYICKCISFPICFRCKTLESSFEANTFVSIDLGFNKIMICLCTCLTISISVLTNRLQVIDEDNVLLSCSVDRTVRLWSLHGEYIGK